MARSSTKPRRKYSEDTLLQIVHEFHNEGKSCAEISKSLDVSETTIRRTVKLWEATGKVRKEKERSSGRPALIDEEAHAYLKALVELDQVLTLKDIAKRLKDSFGIRPALATISRTLKELGYTRLKKPQENSRSSKSASPESEGSE